MSLLCCPLYRGHPIPYPSPNEAHIETVFLLSRGPPFSSCLTASYCYDASLACGVRCVYIFSLVSLAECVNEVDFWLSTGRHSGLGYRDIFKGDDDISRESQV